MDQAQLRPRALKSTSNGLIQKRRRMARVLPTVTLFILFSHALAGAVALVAAELMTGRTAKWLVIPLAAGIGLVLSLTLQRDLNLAFTAMKRLARGEALPEDMPQTGLLAPIFEAMALLSAKVRDTLAVRAQLVETVGSAAAQEERNRLARDLHDSVKQQIFSMSISAAAATARWDSDPTGAKAALDDVRRSAQAAMAEMRALLQQLAPAPLEKVGLLQALRDQCEALGYRSGAAVTCDLGGVSAAALDEGLPPGAQENLFRIAQEALSNVARHARASHVRVALLTDADHLVLEVADDGQGFTSPQNVSVGAWHAMPSQGDDQHGGMGLANMHQRVGMIGGKLHVESAPGGGTTLRARVPLHTPQALVPAEVGDAAAQAQARKWQTQIVILRWVGLVLLSIALFVFSIGARSVGVGVQGALEVLLIAFGTSTGVVAFFRADALLARVHLTVGASSEIAQRLRLHAATIFANGFLFLYWLLPFFPLNWSEWRSAPLISLVIAGIFGLITAGMFARMWRLTQAYQAALPPDKRREQIGQAWGSTRTGALFMLLITGVVLFTRGTFTFPPRTYDDWFNTFLVFNLPVITVCYFGALLVYWRQRRALAQD
jgi:signal transduction histidine kinase